MIRFELNEEMYVACVIVNESLYDNNVDRKKAVIIRKNYLILNNIKLILFRITVFN